MYIGAMLEQWNMHSNVRWRS